ncbi:NAD(P)/FAD-dependent oxidoreductase [Nitrolancea hollandica]|uniref:Geranylgeranyl reductase n=1 Tax=Nitrolancea hollandica Lb TaxID=1129897 RepID=I4EHK0_9BACT|nr:geranylgeranyl reductase family protein [Nitrolancea hollandica]CCF84162.1 Geranylgeranyl reductase [Nitrolancea hollandica Lb]
MLDLLKHDRPDVLVIGGGPAGATSAILLAQQGHDVVLLDKARFPRAKACAEYLNPAAAAILGRIGIHSRAMKAGAVPIDGMTVITPREARFTLDYASGTPYPALGLSREQFDWLLITRAREAGVDVRENSPVREVAREPDGRLRVRVVESGRERTLRPRLLIGADGRYSVVARGLGLSRDSRWPRRIGLAAHYRDFPLMEGFGEMHVASHGYCGIAPQEEGRVNVAMVLDLARFRAPERARKPVAECFESLLVSFPGLAERAAQAERVSPVRGVGPLAHRVTRVAGDGFLLVGDAAGFFDPFTGEGIYDALRGGELAAATASQALRKGDVSASGLESYRRARHDAFAAKRRAAWLMQLFLHYPSLLAYTAGRISRRPGVTAVMSGALGGYGDAGVILTPGFLWQALRP